MAACETIFRRIFLFFIFLIEFIKNNPPLTEFAKSSPFGRVRVRGATQLGFHAPN
jgi:hypothetical protein